MWGRASKTAQRNQNRRHPESRGLLLQVNARNGEKSRDRTHKVSALVVLVVALAGATWAAAVGAEVIGKALFDHNTLFTIRHIDVRSNGRLRPENVREYGKVAEGQNLFAVDIASVRAQLEDMPLIRSAEVRRVLPDTLVIRVLERSALGRLAGGASGHPMLVDQDGYVMGLGRQSPLPLITGATERGLGPRSVVREKAVLDALGALALCDTTRLGSAIHIQSIDVRDPDRMVLALAGGEQVSLGRDQLQARLEKLADVLKTAQELGQVVQSVDLTVLRNVPVVYKAQ